MTNLKTFPATGAIVINPDRCPKCNCTVYAEIEATNIHGMVNLVVACTMVSCDFVAETPIDVNSLIEQHNLLENK